jgi:uracil phosphoribosyltransferase
MVIKVKSAILIKMKTMNNTSKPGYLEHCYGANYNILDDKFLNSHLANLCKEKTKQPLINDLVSKLYEFLIKEVITQEFPSKHETVRTRMADGDARGFWKGEIIETETPAVVVDIARAGTLPGELCFRVLNQTLNPDLVRQDHLYMARKTNEDGQVVGVSWTGSKIGGSIDKAIVLIPDPMGATGSSISKAVYYYKQEIEGQSTKFISLNLIVTPEFIKRMKTDHPELIVYALRVDRGASSPSALASMPGTLWDEESGLTDNQYIIPGAGGLGELMNNSYC